MSEHYRKAIRDVYGDQATVSTWNTYDGTPLVTLVAIERSYLPGSSEPSPRVTVDLAFTPGDARRLAKALKRAAKASELAVEA